MGKEQPILRTEMLMVGYQSGKTTIKAVSGPLNLSLSAGQLICLLGPNGCGKSTLLRTIAGLQEPLAGLIELDGKNIVSLKPIEVARQISLVLTDNVRSGNLDVYSLVSLGRYPYSGWLGRLTEEDKKAIDYALQVTDTAVFLGRKLDSLSDGECQKVMLARAIAQDTPFIILDEPTAHLDLPSRIQLMRLLHQLAKETGKAILMSTHELDLALQVADQIWLMSKDGHLASGPPEELVLNSSFQRAFEKEGISFDLSTGTFPIHLTGEKEIRVIGEGAVVFWTKKALTRHGFVLRTDQEANLTVTIVEDTTPTRWILDQHGLQTTYTQLSEFLKAL